VSSLCDGKHRPYILERFKTLYPDAVRRSSSRSVRNGEAHHNTTLTEADVLEIRRRYVDEERTTSYTLAEEYGTTGSAMSSIISGKTWGHVPMPDGIEEAIDAGRRRAAKGSAANKSDLTEGDVLEIRRRYVEEDITQKALSEQYQISHSSLNSIVNRKTWTHI
jgi:plasmid maintenance system antidote protein VapI